MRIGILSDSHLKTSYQNDVIKLFKEQGASYLIHAGDICVEENLSSLEESKLPYVCVFGNNDMPLIGVASKYNIKKEPYYFKIKDHTFKLMHLPYYLSGDTDIVISGHTHTFKVEFINNTLFINPGETCARKKPLIECALLEINQNKYIISYYYKDINSDKWEVKNFEYDKQ